MSKESSSLGSDKATMSLMGDAGPLHQDTMVLVDNNDDAKPKARKKGTIGTNTDQMEYGDDDNDGDDSDDDDDLDVDWELSVAQSQIHTLQSNMDHFSIRVDDLDENVYEMKGQLTKILTLLEGGKPKETGEGPGKHPPGEDT